MEEIINNPHKYKVCLECGHINHKEVDKCTKCKKSLFLNGDIVTKQALLIQEHERE